MDFYNRRIGLPPSEFRDRLLGDDALKKEITQVSMKVGGGTLNVSAYGDGVQMTRLIGETNVHNDFLRLRKDMQSGGIVKRVAASQFQMWRDLNMKTVDLLANIDVGGYAWARYGFEPVASDMERIKRTIRSRTTRTMLSPDSTDVVRKALASSDPKMIWKVADLPEGKDLLLNTDWSGIIRLDDEIATARFTAYVSKTK